ncbi:NAD(P)/FAD-dependent oxidoreductase [Labrys monachus]|uniref:Nitrite reductase (NADH) large subunit n=1 Tax=Labrys monachus TaxID=217067 RepID=A0ABU0FL38_9HYPH|nr:FAD-dependent oxidoreductase [Labrys monachus]MDQ0395322.1 nitrite reductase (NADH) large subunit [Labrys monachus]
MLEKLLIVGNGMASVRLCEEVMRHAPGRFAVTVVGSEPQAGYNRVLLSALLAGDIGEAEIALRDRDWYEAHGIRLLTGRRVMAIDPAGRQAVLEDGGRLAFDRLVLATGSSALRLPMPGMSLPGVMSFRDLGDLAAMRQAAQDGRRIAVIGGGLLGIEAAYALAKGGAPVTLVHVMDRLMERQLDRRSAAFLKRAIERKGIRVLLDARTTEVVGRQAAEGLAFADGSCLPADLVVVAAGVRPNIELAVGAGLPTKRGVLIDDHLSTVVPFIHAIGECAEHRGIVYGLVQPAYEQAAVLARRWGGELDAAYEGTALSTNLKVSGIPVFSAGDFLGEAGSDDIILEDRAAGLCKRLVLKGRRLVGAALVGEAEDGLWYRDLIRTRSDISAIRDGLIFGRAFCETLSPGLHREAA